MRLSLRNWGDSSGSGQSMYGSFLYNPEINGGLGQGKRGGSGVLGSQCRFAEMFVPKRACIVALREVKKIFCKNFFAKILSCKNHFSPFNTFMRK
jgi:hypothetical protein